MCIRDRNGEVKLTKNKDGGGKSYNKPDRKTTKRKGGFFKKRNNNSNDDNDGDATIDNQQQSSVFITPVFEKVKETPKPSRPNYKKTSESDLFGGGKEKPVSGNYNSYTKNLFDKI